MADDAALELQRIRATQRATILVIERMLTILTENGTLPPHKAAFELNGPMLGVIDPELRKLWELVWRRLGEVQPAPPSSANPS